MSAKILFTLPDESVWQLDAVHVANERAAYYALLDVERGDADDFDEQFKIERDFTLGDNSEIMDWLGNNMKAGDFVGFLEKHASAPPVDMIAEIDKLLRSGDGIVIERSENDIQT